MPAEDLTFLLR